MKLLVLPLAMLTLSCASGPKTLKLSEVETSHKNMLTGNYDVLEEHEKIAVPTFKMAFAIQSDVNAFVSGGRSVGGGEVSSASAAMTTYLTGVEVSEMQAMTDAAYAKFLEDLKKTGRQIIPFEAIKAHESFKDLELAKTEAGKPFIGTLDGRKYLVFTPTGMPLFFRAGEPLTDQFIGLGNTKVLGSISYDLKAVTVVPTISIDFASTTSSETGGAALGMTSAEVNTMPELSILGGLHTQMSILARDSWIATATLPGVASLKPEKILISNDFGQVTELSTKDNADISDSLARLFGASAVTSSVKSVRQIKVTGEKYKALVEPAVAKVTETFVNAIAETK